MAIHSYRFDRFELTPSTRHLSRDGVALKVEPRTFSLLLYLIENRHRVVPSRELLRNVWSGRVVSTASVGVSVSGARRVLGDTASRQHTIRTAYGTGYQFVAPVISTIEECRAESDLQERRSLVGRERELQVCQRWFDDPTTGGSLFLVSGSPGIGKTRFLNELVEKCTSQAGIARCDEFADRAPLHLWRQAFRSTFVDAANLSDDARVSPNNACYRYFETLRRSLYEEFGDGPTLIAIDDLHCADELSLKFLRYLISSPESSQSDVRFLATYRDVDARTSSKLFFDILASATREHPELSVHLTGLTESATAELVASRIDRHLDDREVGAIWERSKGNPLFALLLASSGIGRDRLANLPLAIAAAATSHLARLDSTTREILEVASAFGRRFSMRSLERCSRVGTRALLEATEKAARLNVIDRTSEEPGFFSFVHSLVQESLYEQIPPTKRSLLHQRIASFAIDDWDSDVGDLESHEIAFHLSRAGDPRAREYHLVSARDAEERYSYEQAAHQYREALAISTKPSSDDCIGRFRLLLSLGRCALLAGDGKQAAQVFHRASEAARRLDQPALLAEVALRSAPDFFSIECGVYDRDLINLLEESYRGLRDGSVLKTRVAARLILALIWANGTEARVEELYSFVRHRVLGSQDQRLLAEVLPALWRAKWDQDCLGERLRFARNLPQPDGGTYDESLLVCKMLTVAAHLESGCRESLENAIQEFSALASRARHPRAVWYAEMFHAVAHLMRGDFREAEDRYKRFSRLATKVGDSNGLHSAALHEFLLLWEAGRPSEFVSKSEKAVARYPNVPGWRATLAFMYSEAGDVASSMREYDVLKRGGIEKSSFRIDWISAFTIGLAQTCYALEDSQFAPALYKRLQPYSGREAIAGAGALACGSIDRYLGLLAETMGCDDRAMSHYRQAIEFDQKLGARPWVVHAQLNASRLLSRLGRTSESTSLCRAAVVAAKEIGMQNAAFKGERLLRLKSRAPTE